MTKLSLVVPATGELNTVAEPKVDTALSTIQTWANGEIEGTNNIKAEGVTEANLTAAVQTLLNTKSAFALTNTKQSGPYTAVSGDFVLMGKSGETVTLPAATNNRIVGVYLTTNGSMTVKAPVANTIYGDLISAATTITLTTLQHVILQAEGTNWLIIAGEPKREQKYEVKSFTKTEIEAGVEFSATRPVIVNKSSVAFTVETGTVSISLPTQINPGQKINGTPASTPVTFTFLLL